MLENEEDTQKYEKAAGFDDKQSHEKAQVNITDLMEPKLAGVDTPDQSFMNYAANLVGNLN